MFLVLNLGLLHLLLSHACPHRVHLVIIIYKLNIFPHVISSFLKHISGVWVATRVFIELFEHLIVILVLHKSALSQFDQHDIAHISSWCSFKLRRFISWSLWRSRLLLKLQSWWKILVHSSWVPLHNFKIDKGWNLVHLPWVHCFLTNGEPLLFYTQLWIFNLRAGI